MKRLLVLVAAAALIIGVSLPAAAVTQDSDDLYVPVEGQAFARSAEQDVDFAAAALTSVAAVGRPDFSGEAKPVPVPAYVSGAYFGPVPSEFSGMFTTWPVDGGVLNDGFGYRDGGEFHSGDDILAPGGTPIKAVAAGVVVRIDADGGLGQYVMIDHGSGVVSGYAHMIAGSPVVSPGQSVAAGETIGLVGDTGYATTTHVHLLVELNGSRVDPMPFFG
jgi:murein DD-endopeptidase MepM/ murein hydrolase activator NlpD